MSILIPSHCDDVHALAVHHVLKNKDILSLLYIGADYPSQMLSTSTIDDKNDLHYEIEGTNIYYSNISSDIDVVWLRRETNSIIPLSLNKSDRDFMQDECSAYSKSFWNSLPREAYWVNSIEGMKRASNKLLQLQLAKKSGFKIPPTLMTNDISKARSFIKSNPDTTIYKPFNQRQWVTVNGKYSIWASDVKLSDLDHESSLRFSPGIFQKKIKKKSELRLTFMGTHCIPVRINSQFEKNSQDDWRKVSPSKLNMEVIDINPKLYEKCINLMKSFGIEFCIFDIIETLDNDFIFLEINEMGQFLWIEEELNHVPMLDMFVKFLTNKNFNFQYKKENDCVFWNDLRTEDYFKKWVSKLKKNHMSHPNNFVVYE